MIKKVLQLLFFATLCVAFAVPAHAANNVYVAQTSAGTGSGLDCADAKAISYFNTSANWSATPTGIQIGPDTTVHICATVTTEMFFQGGGSSGHPLTLLWETGAVVQISPGADGNGAVNLGGNSFIIVDGGTSQPCGWNTATNTSDGACNGKIQNMLYGTTGASCPGGTCTTEADSTVGNLLQTTGGGNIEVRNLEVGPSYIHISSGAGLSDTHGTQGILFSQASNINIHNMKCRDGVWCIVQAFNTNFNAVNWNISNSEMFNDSHMAAWGGGPPSPTNSLNGATFTGNYCHDMSNWDTTSDAWHANCLHVYTGGAGSSYTNLTVNNNIAGGHSGADMTAQFFLEAQGGPASNVNVFNNLMYVTGGMVGGARLLLLNDCTPTANCNVLNNTFEGSSSSNGTCQYIGGNGGTTTKMNLVENNAVDDCFGVAQSELSTYVTIDWNRYAPTTNNFIVTGNTFVLYNSGSPSWVSSTGEGTHSANVASLGISGTTFMPLTGSTLIGNGNNLTAQCTGALTALCADLAGIARPASGAWDIGAYQFTSGPGTVATPTFSPVAGTYTVTQTVTISTATSGATLCYTTDGSTPTANGAGTCTHGTTYSGTISVSTSQTVKAIGSLSGDTDSAVGSAAYVIAPVVATPTFSPVAGTYTSTQSVTISTSTGGATLCYTTDGSTPTANGAGTCTHGTTYTTAVSVASSQTLKARGSLSGDTDSSVATAAYVINSTVATPTFNPVAGTYASAQNVTISTATGGATLCWTNDGSTPAATAGTCTHGTTYTTTVTVPSSLTLKALGSISGGVNSAVGSAAYTIAPTACGPPNYACPGRAVANDDCVLQVLGGGPSQGTNCPPTDTFIPNLNNGNATCIQGLNCSAVDPQFGNILMTRCTDGQLNGVITSGIKLNRTYEVGTGGSGDSNNWNLNSTLLSVFDTGDGFVIESVDTTAHTCYPVLSSGGTPFAPGSGEFSGKTSTRYFSFFSGPTYTIGYYDIICSSPGHPGGCSVPGAQTIVADFSFVLPYNYSSQWLPSHSYTYGDYAQTYMSNSQNATVTAATCLSNNVTYTTAGIASAEVGGLMTVTGLSSFNSSTPLTIATSNAPGTSIKAPLSCTNGTITGQTGTMTLGSQVIFQDVTSGTHTSGSSTPSWNSAALSNVTDGATPITWVDVGTANFQQGGGWSTVGGVSGDETKYSGAFSNNNFDATANGALGVNMNGNQNTGFLAASYDTVADTYYEYNTGTGIAKSFTCTGGTTGYNCTRGSSGVTVLGQVNPASPNPGGNLCENVAPFGATTCQFYIHNDKIFKGGAYSTVGPEFNANNPSGPGNGPASAKFQWQFGTNQVAMVINGAAGHATERFIDYANFAGNQSAIGGVGQIRVVSNTAANTFANFFINANTNQTDGHFGWYYLNGSTDDTTITPIGGAIFDTTNFPYINPYTNELLIIPTCGSSLPTPACSPNELQPNQVSRMAHAWSYMTNRVFNTQFIITSYSQDGTAMAVSTDWLGNFGSVDGNPVIAGFPWSSHHTYTNSTITPTSGNAGTFSYTQTGTCLSSTGAGPGSWNQTLGGTTTDGTCTFTNAGVDNARGDVVIAWLNSGGGSPPLITSPPAPAIGLFAEVVRNWDDWWVNGYGGL